MKKRIAISEPERLERFMTSFDQHHSEDFKALVLHLLASSDINVVAAQTSLPTSTLYEWQADWHKKKKLAYKTVEGKEQGQSPA